MKIINKKTGRSAYLNQVCNFMDFLANIDGEYLDIWRRNIRTGVFALPMSTKQFAVQIATIYAQDGWEPFGDTDYAVTPAMLVIPKERRL